MIPSRCSAEAAVYFYLATFALPFSLDIGLLGLAVLGSRAALASAPRFPSGILAAFLFLMLVIGMGNVGSPDFQRSLRLSLALIPACLVYFLISGYFGKRQLIGLCLTWALIACALGGWMLMVSATHPQMSPTEWIVQGRLTAFKVPNDIVLFQILLPFPLALFKLSPKFSAQSWLAWAAIAISLSLAVVYHSRLAILIGGVSMALFFLLLRESKQLFRIGTVACLGLILMDAALGFTLTTKFLSSWTSRLPLWWAAWQMFLQSPLTGHGIGSYLLLYKDYLNPTQWPDWVVHDPRVTPWAHNLYLEILAELGIIGALAFVGLLLFSIKPKYFQISKNPQQQILTSAVIVALIAFCLSGLFELSLWRQWVGLTFLLIIGCISATNKFQEGTS
ncbi:MAG: hypothetical protein Kow0060_18210 [Methylohalobius crimeensis]